MSKSKNDIELKLSAARTRLIIEKPFLGALVLRLPTVAANPSSMHNNRTLGKNHYFHNGPFLLFSFEFRCPLIKECGYAFCPVSGSME